MTDEELWPFLIHKEATVVEALHKIDKNSKGLLFVVNNERKLEGVITDGDIRRWLIKTGDLQGKVEFYMNTHPLVIYHNDPKSASKIMAKNQITALPVIDDSKILFDIIFSSTITNYVKRNSHSLNDVTVVIMAGGKGTRLYPFTKILPKPLIPVGDIPIMERIINKFLEFGINDFYVTINYRKNMIRAYFSEQKLDYHLNYVEEDKPLGTAGSLKLINRRFDRPIIVTNCDILIHADYDDIYKYHVESRNDLTIISALKNIMIPYGVLHSSKDGTVEGLEEKPKISCFINTGMYVINPNLVDDIPANAIFHMTDLIELLLKKGGKVGLYPVSEDSFLDMGEFEEMHRMEEKLNLKSE